ncbi:hypothetical protein [Anaerostipes hominis (ex Lee et al. 2021)]|uniref:hypothetical protein n=1 Tax=Anaerostipes hominis (ex Lee et al. 2021) TaxID=2025494 RepID=UPI0022E9212E|nr:hypothetical protein [Anaerostipes hominis (ex Lee et al. 2021)]
MNEMQIFQNDEVGKVRLMENEDGSISISAEDTAMGFGWTTVAKSGNEVIRWARINEYCKQLGFSPEVGKDDYIPESLFYMLGMKANNPTALKFQKWLAFDVIPSIRKTGSYKADTNSDLYMEAARILAETPKHTKAEVINVLRHVVPDISTMEEKPIKKDYSVPFDFNHFDNYLKKYGVTTQVLSMKSDVCAQLIYKYRNGKTVPTMETRKKLTEALGIAENYFNHEKGSRRRYS